MIQCAQMGFYIGIATRSETGLVRRDNQDSVLCLPGMGVFAVDDTDFRRGIVGHVGDSRVFEGNRRFAAGSFCDFAIDSGSL